MGWDGDAGRGFFDGMKKKAAQDVRAANFNSKIRYDVILTTPPLTDNCYDKGRGRVGIGTDGTGRNNMPRGTNHEPRSVCRSVVRKN